tara:strand:- start:524 stop:712 length:189 start_codon:yes stop_codon:yes gene_type:complete
MIPKEMTTSQLQAQLARVRKEIRQWTELIQGQMAGEARTANEKHRDRLHNLAIDLNIEINYR